MDLHGNYQYFVQCYHFDNSPPKRRKPISGLPLSPVHLLQELADGLTRHLFEKTHKVVRLGK